MDKVSFHARRLMPDRLSQKLHVRWSDIERRMPEPTIFHI